MYIYIYWGRDDANTCIEHNVTNDIGVLDRCRAATSGCHCDSSAFSLRLGHLASGRGTGGMQNMIVYGTEKGGFNQQKKITTIYNNT